LSGWSGKKFRRNGSSWESGIPRRVHRWLAEKNHSDWDLNQALGTLEARDVERIRAVPEVAALSAFLQEMQQGDQAA
jgi:hypothetical protein